MKHVIVTLVLTAVAAIATGAPLLNPEVEHALTSIDTVPTKQQIDAVFSMSSGGNPLDTLVALATNADPDPTKPIDPGVRLRAIHALTNYCATTPCTATDIAHQSIVSVVTDTRNVSTGTDVLLLRAAIETLGSMRVSTDVTLLEPLLDHPSRDIRAATARALRDLCNTHAITPLRQRYSGEMTDQVKLAISEALRILGQCSANP